MLNPIPAVRKLASMVLTSILLSGCGNSAPTLTDQEKEFVQKLTTEMTTRCVGRYLIDLPASMKINNQHRIKIDEVLIRIEPMDVRNFEYNLDLREKELKVLSLDGQPDTPFLKKVEILPAPMMGKVFNRAESQGGADFGRTLELHAWRDDYYIQMEVEATDSTDPKYRDHPRVSSYPTDVKEKLQTLIDLLSRTHGRKDIDIPSTPGTCIPNGFINGPATSDEEIGIAYELTEDVWLGFDTITTPESNTLLDRAKDIEWALKESEGRTVRKGRRESAEGVKFEEWLSALRTDDRIMGHDFFLEAYSLSGSKRTPRVNIDLSNGSRAPRPERPYDAPFPPDFEKASLSEAEAVALWDAITNTLRPRPGAF